MFDAFNMRSFKTLNSKTIFTCCIYVYLEYSLCEMFVYQKYFQISNIFSFVLFSYLGILSYFPVLEYFHRLQQSNIPNSKIWNSLKLKTSGDRVYYSSGWTQTYWLAKDELELLFLLRVQCWDYWPVPPFLCVFVAVSQHVLHSRQVLYNCVIFLTTKSFGVYRKIFGFWSMSVVDCSVDREIWKGIGM